MSKKLQSQTVSNENLCKILTYKKSACKMLMKLTPVADPIKLFFFANEEFFRFLLLS
jgi:hypothetical protein